MSITEIVSKKASGVQSLSSSLSQAAGLTSGDKNAFASQLNSQFSIKSDSTSQLATQKAAMQALAKNSPATDTQEEEHAKAQKAAQGLVANALILPILKQIRRSQSEQKGYFSPGNGEKSFGPQFDMQLSDRIAQSPNLAITKSLTTRLEKHSAASAKKTTATAQKKLDVNG